MRHDIKSIIEHLQWFQNENPNETLIDEDEMLAPFRAMKKVNSIDDIIKKVESLVEDRKENNENITIAAALIGVERATIYKWINDGIINKYRWQRTEKEAVISLKELKESLNKIKAAKLLRAKV
jgi:hypothetical protein